MTGNGPYILGAWLTVMVVLAAYAAYVIVRGRQLARRVPVERRRWVDTPDPTDTTGGPTP